MDKNDNKTVYRTKQSTEYFFFNQRCKETVTNSVMASRFWLDAYIVRLCDSQFSLFQFNGIKYILARKMRRNAQSDNNRV